MEKNIKEISEIKCNAKNCVYNEDGTKCIAGSIEVGTKNARSSMETLCATFQACTDNNATN